MMTRERLLTRICAIVVGCMFVSLLAPAQTSDSTKQKMPFFKIYFGPKTTVVFGLYRRGTYHIYGKVYVIGSLQLEQEGIRFLPMTKTPEGYLPQEAFDRTYWYNSIFTDVFIPYSDVASIRKKSVFRLKDGRKLYLSGFGSHWKTTFPQIAANVARAKGMAK